MKWRCFGTNYRGVFPDAFLDGREVVPPVAYWTGRAMVPPSRRHVLLVWGRPGTVQGYLDAGPTDPTDPERAQVGEVFELYVDPASQGHGGGGRLLDAGEEALAAAGFVDAELSVVDANTAGRAFYEGAGWSDTGRTVAVDLGVVAFVERRFGRSL